jgi:hypothetical protein
VGPAAWVLRAEPLCFSLLLVYLTWLLAGALADSMPLSAAVHVRFQTIAALVAALPPLYDGVIEMRVWGGYIETFVLSLWLLYSVVRLSQRWFRRIGLGESLLRWVGIGLLAGIGLWVDPLIELPLLICILWLLGTSFVALVTARQHGCTRQEALYALRRNWLASIATVPAALLGFIPGLFWGYSHQWENILYILHPGRNVIAYDPYIAAAYPTRLDKIRGVTGNYLTCDLPRAFSGLTPNVPRQQASALAQLLHPQTPVRLAYDITLTIMLVCVVGAVVLFLLSYALRHTGVIHKLLTLPLLFVIVVSGALCLSDLTAHYLVHHTCDADKTGRYASLLILVLPLLVAAMLTMISIETRRGSALRLPSPTGTIFPLVYRVDGSQGYTVRRSPQIPTPERHDQASPGPQYLPTSSERQAWHTARTAPSLTNIIAKVILLLILVLYLSTQSVAYTQVANDGYFRSPLCKIALTHTDQALDYLREQHIRYLWSEIWIGNVLMFKTATNVISTDPRVFTSQLKDRIPDYSNAIRDAEHASVAFFASQDDNLLERLKTLDAAHIKYQTARFTVDRGVDLIILTPVDHTFQPSEATALVIGGPGC